MVKAYHLNLLLVIFTVVTAEVHAQSDTAAEPKQYKNVIRYNLSSGLLFGFGKYIVFGYERVVGRHQSFSINVGRASLPKPFNISTDSFNLSNERKRTGINISADYRFYLSKENKYNAPRGVYIGPYYAYNHFDNETQWNYKRTSTSNIINTTSKFTIHTVGFEMGYQFIIWKRLTIDLVMVGPGIGFYKYTVTFDGNLDQAKKDQLFKAIEQLITQKFPGMNYVLSDKEFNSNGTITKSDIGYRYLIQIGFNF